MAKKSDIKDKEKFNEIKEVAAMPPEAATPEIDLDAPVKPPRKKRMTKAEKEALSHRPIAIEANPLFVPVVKIPFDIWAKTTVPEMSLTDDEARVFALPITQLVEYYLPQMPDIWAVWANLAVQLFGIMSVRMSILAAIRKELAKKNRPEAAPGSSPAAGNGFPGEFRPKVI